MSEENQKTKYNTRKTPMQKSKQKVVHLASTQCDGSFDVRVTANKLRAQFQVRLRKRRRRRV